MKNFLLGRWNVIGSEYFNEDGKWEKDKNFESDEYYMIFSARELILEEIVGQLTEHFDGASFETTYSYDPSKGLLIIDRSDYLDDGFLSVCIEDWYKVEMAGEICYLDLVNEADCPPPYYRLKMRR